MTFRKLLMLVLAAMLLLPMLAQAEDNSADTLLMEELEEWVNRYHARALASEPLNNPAKSRTEDGYEFIYDFATVYASSAKMTEDTVISAVVVTSPGEEGPRGLCIDDSTQVVLSAFYSENPTLAGSRDFAVLYTINLMPETLQWAQVQRDGQRVETIQYAVHEQLSTGGEGYSDAGLIFTMQDGLVSAIRVYGLDSRITQRQVLDVADNLRQNALEEGYTQVPFSYDGASLEKFGGEDLTINGVNCLGLTPEMAISMMGQPVADEWMEDGDNGYIRSMVFGSCELTFLCDKNQQNPQMYMILITQDGVEGPRAVRVGDSFAEVFNRFRNGEGEFDGVTTEVLYGDEATGEFGVAEYGSDAGVTLRYGLVLEDGRHVVLHMTFTGMQLSEIMLYTVQ